MSKKCQNIAAKPFGCCLFSVFRLELDERPGALFTNEFVCQPENMTQLFKCLSVTDKTNLCG